MNRNREPLAVVTAGYSWWSPKGHTVRKMRAVVTFDDGTTAAIAGDGDFMWKVVRGIVARGRRDGRRVTEHHTGTYPVRKRADLPEVPDVEGTIAQVAEVFDVSRFAYGARGLIYGEGNG